MAVSQSELPLAALVYDAEGSEIARVPLGRLPRDHATALSLDAVSPKGSGTAMAMSSWYTISPVAAAATAGCMRCSAIAIARAAMPPIPSFGAHIFNTILTYRDEPQSYVGRPPGLSTRLFLRLGEGEYDTHLPPDLSGLAPVASGRARPRSFFMTREGAEIARAALAIPCSGSRHLRYHALFDEATRARAGAGAYGVIRDPTCRLFGYHGLVGEGGAFSLDHMFGF